MAAWAQSTRRKLSMLQLAQELQNASKACRIMGYHLLRVGRCGALTRRVSRRWTGGAQRVASSRRAARAPTVISRIAPLMEVVPRDVSRSVRIGQKRRGLDML